MENNKYDIYEDILGNDNILEEEEVIVEESEFDDKKCEEVMSNTIYT